MSAKPPPKPTLSRFLGDRFPRLAATLQPVVLAQDPSPFGKWLYKQRKRDDAVGQLAQVIGADATWPGGQSRELVFAYFEYMEARPHVMQIVADAWTEFETQRAVDKRHAKNKLARKARKKNRRKSRAR